MSKNTKKVISSRMRTAAIRLNVLRIRKYLAIADRYFWQVSIGLPIGIMSMFMVGVLMSAWGFAQANFLLAFLLAVIALPVGLHPATQALRIFIQKTTGLKNLEFGNWAKNVVIAVLLMGVVFVVIGTFKMSHLGLTFAMLVVLYFIALASLVFGGEKWRNRIIWGVLLSVLAILFYSIFLRETRVGQRVGETTESAYMGLAGKTYQFDQVIASKMTVEISNFKDYNGNGVVDDGEMRPVQLPEGCYRIQIGGPSGAPSVRFSNSPNQPTALTGALRMGTDGDMGYRNEESFWVSKGSKALIGFDTPDQNVRLVDENGQPSWNFTPVSLTESTDCQKPE